MTAPKRFQLRRTRGWRKPEGAVSCARPSRWGNPYRVVMEDGSWVVRGNGFVVRGFESKRAAADAAARYYRDDIGEQDRRRIREQLAGRDLGCYCAEGDPCHVDVLLAIANEGVTP